MYITGALSFLQELASNTDFKKYIEAKPKAFLCVDKDFGFAVICL